MYTLVPQRAQTEGICGGNQGVSQCDGGGVFWGESWGCFYLGVHSRALTQAVRERERDRETERQRDRETERQRDRETERQRDRETEREVVEQKVSLSERRWESIRVGGIFGSRGYIWE